MPKIEQRFRRQMAKQGLLSRKKTIIVAVSTGVDSMSLLTLLLSINVAQRPTIVVAHVNHELRSASADEEKFIQQFCQVQHLSLEIKHWPVADHPKHGIEAAGRQFRYQFFGELMQRWQATTVLTAHHADDQAETFLMKLTRGGALQQLTGIAWQQKFYDGRLIRPLLSFSKHQLRKYADSQHLQYFEDVTNQSTDFQRNRMRHLVIPELKKENPQFLAHIADYQRQLTDLLNVTRELSDQYWQKITIANNQYSLAGWRVIPTTVRRLMLQELMLTETHRGSNQERVAQIDHWLQTQATNAGQLALEGGRCLKIVDGKFGFSTVDQTQKKSMNFTESMVILNQWQHVGSTLQIAVFAQQPELGLSVTTVWLAPEELPLRVRHWRIDDQLALSTGQVQSVKKALQNAKVSAEERQVWPLVVTAQDRPIWLPQVRASWLPTQNGKQQVFLQVKDIRGLKGETLPNE